MSTTNWDFSLKDIIKKNFIFFEKTENILKKLENYHVNKDQISSLIEELKFEITTLKTIEYLSLITILFSMILFFVTLHNGYNAAINEYMKSNLSHVSSSSALKGAMEAANNGVAGGSVIYYKNLLSNKNYYLFFIFLLIGLSLCSTIYKRSLKKNLQYFICTNEN